MLETADKDEDSDFDFLLSNGFIAEYPDATYTITPLGLSALEEGK